MAPLPGKPGNAANGANGGRENAREARKRLKGGQRAFEAPPTEPASLRAVAKNYHKRHVEANKLRSQADIERYLDKDIYPVWEGREFAAIRRGDKLATGGVTDVETAADGLTTVLNAYGAEAGSATDVSDALFVALKAGKATVG